MAEFVEVEVAAEEGGMMVADEICNNITNVAMENACYEDGFARHSKVLLACSAALKSQQMVVEIVTRLW